MTCEKLLAQLASLVKTNLPCTCRMEWYKAERVVLEECRRCATLKVYDKFIQEYKA